MIFVITVLLYCNYCYLCAPACTLAGLVQSRGGKGDHYKFN